MVGEVVVTVAFDLTLVGGMAEFSVKIVVSDTSVVIYCMANVFGCLACPSYVGLVPFFGLRDVRKYVSTHERVLRRKQSH